MSVPLKWVNTHRIADVILWCMKKEIVNEFLVFQVAQYIENIPIDRYFSAVSDLNRKVLIFVFD